MTDLEFDGEVDVTSHILMSISVDDNTQEPRQRRDARDYRDQHHPEPQEQVDLLVEQVDRQHALDAVAMHGAQTTHLHARDTSSHVILVAALHHQCV